MNNEYILKDFPIIKNSKVTYLDSGATTQKPISVLKEVEKYYNNFNANPNRGAYSLSIKSTQLYENARENVANFINANSKNEVIFTKNATESLNLIAYCYGLNNIKENDEIVLSIMEHHSNLVPWQMVAKKNKAILKYMYIDNQEFVNSLEQFDVLMANTDKEEDIISVNEAILSSYEEIILGN